jgi:hypothetical protein
MCVVVASSSNWVSSGSSSYQDGPASCWATDSSGDDWLVVHIDDNPDHLAWLCAPVSARALLAVLHCHPQPEMPCATAYRDLRTRSGRPRRAVPDRCLLGASLPARPSGGADRAAAWAA